MALEKQPFTSYTLEQDKNPDDLTFTIRLNAKEREWFKQAKNFIRQPKNSTAIKQLAEIGAINVLHDKKIARILEVIQNNYRRNERTGVSERDYEI